MTKFVTPVPLSSINQSGNASAALITGAAYPRVPVQTDRIDTFSSKGLQERQDDGQRYAVDHHSTAEAHTATITPTPQDRPFNGFRTAVATQARALVSDISEWVQEYEKVYKVRLRARKQSDQQTFVCQIEALVSDLTHREITEPGGWLALSFSKRVLGSNDRYRASALTKTLPDVIRTMAKPELQLVEFEIGYHNPFNNALSRQTVIRAGVRLRALIADRQLQANDFGSDKSEEIIVLKSCKDGFFDKGKRIPYADTPQTNGYRENLKRINTYLAQADIQFLPSDTLGLQVDISDRRLYRIFNNGSFEQGGRLFGGFWQPMSKKQRRDIRIDGGPVVTLDYGQIVPRILYGHAGEDPRFEDAYAVTGLGFYRDGVKKVFNSMLHSDKPLTKMPRGTRSLIPKKYSVAEVTAMITEAHRPIAPYFYAGQGLQFMFHESRILIEVLNRLIEMDITGLPIHDAVIVSEEHAAQTKQVMLEVFKDLMCIEGVVEIE